MLQIYIWMDSKLYTMFKKHPRGKFFSYLQLQITSDPSNKEYSLLLLHESIPFI